MKPTLLAALTAIALVFGACSSTPTKVDTGTIRAVTYSYVNTAGKAAPGYAEQRKPGHVMVQNAIAKTMQSRGLTQVATGGELTVAYLIIVGNNASTASIDDYFGYGRDADALHQKAQAAYTNNKNPNYFEAGTLVIDLIETKTHKLLYRGYATKPLLRDLSDEARAARVQEVVDEILREVKFAR